MSEYELSTRWVGNLAGIAYKEYTYKGYWTGEGYYLGDEERAADVHHDFAALTIRRFTGDWEISESDIENALMEVEILRARWCIALARG